MVAGFGTASIAANAVGNTIAMFEILPGMAIGFGLVTVVSQCVGAGDYEQVRYYTKKLMIYTYLSMVAVNVIILIFLPQIMSIYHLSTVTADMAMKILIFHGTSAMVIWPLSFTLPNTLRASNDVRYTMMVGVGSMWICRILFGILLGKYLHWDVFGIWVAMVLDWCVRTVFFVLRYRRGKWENIRL